MRKRCSVFTCAALRSPQIRCIRASTSRLTSFSRCACANGLTACKICIPRRCTARSLLGDERVESRTAAGTLYRETLRIVPTASGTVRIGPGSIDAIDASDGRPKRFLSNELQFTIRSGARTRSSPRAMLWVLAAAFALGAAALWRSFLPSRFGSTPSAAPAVPVGRSAPASQADCVREGFRDLRMLRDRASVIRLRSAIWKACGAERAQTLGDALRSANAADPQIRSLLVALERAAFVDPRSLPGAIDDVLSRQSAAA